jgi:hypothetical protein
MLVCTRTCTAANGCSIVLWQPTIIVISVGIVFHSACGRPVSAWMASVTAPLVIPNTKPITLILIGMSILLGYGAAHHKC